MSTVYANSALDLFSLNLNQLLGETARLLDNVGFKSYLGNTYADAYRIQLGTVQQSYFLGSGLVVDAQQRPTAGTVHGYQENVWNGSAWVAKWGIEGIAIPATQLYNAMLSPSASDELALLAQALAGNDNFRLSGQADRVSGYGGNDTIRGYGGNDTLFGGDGGDRLEGGSGNDRLYGNAGTDSLYGGAGSDTYYVDASDVVVETSTLAGEIDTVRSTGTRALGANLEVLVLDGSAPINGTGNGLHNQIVGNAAINQLAGGAGNDTLRGGAGNDRLDGGAGNDSLIGEAGSDTMIGGSGNDSYVVNSTADVVDEASTVAAEIDTVTTSVTRVLETRVENMHLGGGAAISGTGNALANRMIGNVASNSLSGLAGNDTLLGQDGSDTLLGGSGHDRLDGGAGHDRLDGGTGSDTMVGGSGNDVYVVGSLGDRVTETGTAAAELDTVQATLTWTLGSRIERLTLTGTAALEGTGNTLANRIDGNVASNRLYALGGNDTLFGGAGHDRLDGGSGNDAMNGGSGNDVYIVNAGGDRVTESGTIPTEIDTVVSSVAWTLGSNVERLTLTGSAAIDGRGNGLANLINGNAANNRLYGSAGNDTLVGGSGSDRLDGGSGADAMTGGSGNDLYIVDHSSDQAIETGTAATEVDAVQSSASYVLGAYIEKLTLTGSAAVDGTGNNLANSISGNGANNRLFGGAGNDTLLGAGGIDLMTGGSGNDLYIVDHSSDQAIETGTAATEVDAVQSGVSYVLGAYVEKLTLTGSAPIDGTGNAQANLISGNGAANRLSGAGGNDTLLGGLGNDRLDAGAGNDRLEGGAGSDTQIGGAGNDVFVVDSGDSVSEASAGGSDTVLSNISWTLAANVERLTLGGSSAVNGTGNVLANALTGNDASNRLDGLGGADTMSGHRGNDTYVVDHAGDRVVEAGGAGTDNVESSVSHGLAANVERLKLTGSAAIDGIGNTLANRIDGNTNDNLISGGTGADTMSGGGGDDIYVVERAGDVVVESAGAGTDTVESSIDYTLGSQVEWLELTGSNAIDGSGNGGNNLLVGNEAANLLSGGAGNDTLDGDSGADTLTGGSGADSFLFTSTLDGTVNVDAITDFDVAADRFELDELEFFEAGDAGALSSAAFVVGPSATTADHRIVYVRASGTLMYDEDGVGGEAAAIDFAKVVPDTPLTFNDFLLI